MGPGAEKEFLTAARAGAAMFLVTDEGIEGGLGEDVPIPADVNGRGVDLGEMAGSILSDPVVVIHGMAHPNGEGVGGELRGTYPILDEGFSEDAASVDDVVKVGSANDEILGGDGIAPANRELELGDGTGRGAPGRNAAVAPGLLNEPRQGVLAVGCFEQEWQVVALGSESSPGILGDDGVTAGGAITAEAGAEVFVVGKAEQHDREGAVGFGQPDVGRQLHPIAHGHLLFELDRTGVGWVGSRPGGGLGGGRRGGKYQGCG